jgi:alkylation response protein AidB-like acyl-CoA dehydrogenase
MAELGWMGLIIPEEYEGMGYTFQDLTVLLEEIGRNILPGPLLATVIGAPSPYSRQGLRSRRRNCCPG